MSVEAMVQKMIDDLTAALLTLQSTTRTPPLAPVQAMQEQGCCTGRSRPGAS